MLIRAISLELRVALRSLGIWPWIAVLSLCLIARWQEPLFLRTQQIELTWHAIPMLACLMSLGLAGTLLAELSFSLQRNRSQMPSVLALLAMTMTTCVVTAAAGFSLDMAFGTPPRWQVLVGASCFPVTRLAPALVLAVGLLRLPTPIAARTGLLLCVSAAMILLLGSDPLGAAPSPRTLGVSGLATIGSLGVTTFLCDTRRLP